MKRLLFFITLSISVCPLLAQSPFSDAFVLDSSTDYHFLQSLHPHTEGSENEKRVIRFIEERLALLRIPVQKTDFSKAAGGHSFSYILEASVAGRSPDTLILAIPLNHDFQAPADEDGSFGIALGLKLLEYFNEYKPAVTVKAVFLGGEFESGGDAYLGTEQFLRSFYPVEPHAVLYLNLRSFPARATVRYGGKGIAAPFWLVQTALGSMSSAGVPFLIRGIDLPVYRSGLEIAKTPLAAYLEAGVPGLEIETAGPPESGQSPETRERAFLSFVAGFANSCAGGFPETWDRHYLLITLPLLPPLLISETAYLSGVLFLVFLVILFAMFNVANLKKYAITLKRNFWNIPFFIAAAFILLVGASFSLDALLAVRDFPTEWTFVPALFFLLKLAFFLCACTLLYRIGRRLPFSKNGSFYSAAALLFTALCILVVACINISFGYYFLWPLACIMAGSRARTRYLKVLCFGISPLPVVVLLAELFSLSEPGLIGIFLFNKIMGNLLFAVVILPFLLLLIRIRFLFPYRRGTLLSSKSFLVLAGTLAAGVASAVILAVYNPYDAAHPQPVLAEQVIDLNRGTHTLEISSPAPLGDLQVVDKAGPHPVPPGNRRYLIPLSGVRDYISIESVSTAFLSRKNIDFTLRFQGTPYKLKAAVFSDADFKLYDSNFPAEQVSGRRYALSIGINPPPTLTLALTLPRNRSYTLDLEVLYKATDAGVGVHGDDIALESRLTFRKSIVFGL
jgi:hypothetical protein